MNAAADGHPEAERDDDYGADNVALHELDKARDGRRLNHLPEAAHVVLHSLIAHSLIIHRQTFTISNNIATKQYNIVIAIQKRANIFAYAVVTRASV